MLVKCKIMVSTIKSRLRVELKLLLKVDKEERLGLRIKAREHLELSQSIDELLGLREVEELQDRMDGRIKIKLVEGEKLTLHSK